MNRMNRLGILSLLVVAMATGCTSVNAVGRQTPLAQPDVVDTHVTINDPGLGSAVSVRQVVQSTVAGGLLKIQARLRNTTNDTYSFNYKFEWYDVDGMLVETPSSSWHNSRIYGREQKTISAIAPSPKVVDFQLKLRKAER